MSRHNPLITLQRGSAPFGLLCCIPGAGASVTAFLDLAKLMDGVHVIGMQPSGLDEFTAPYDSVEEAAKDYADAIRLNIADRRIHLVGHSFGAMIALEMALSLEQQARPVCSLILLDAATPHEFGKGRVTESQAFAALVRSIEQTHSIGLVQTIPRAAEFDREYALSELRREMIRKGLYPERASLAPLRATFCVFLKCVRTNYSPRKAYSGVALHVRPSETSTAPCPFWAMATPNAIHSHSTGNHMSMLQEQHLCGTVSTILSIMESR
jgi:syringomycin synthetase protein SyrE